MNIIFVSNKMAKAKTLSVLQVSMIVLALTLVPLFIGLMIIVPQETSAQQGGKTLMLAQIKNAFTNRQKHIDAYAIQLGEMQARIMLLDAQSKRLSRLAEDKSVNKTKLQDPIKPSSYERAKPNRGGPLVRESPLSEVDLQEKISELMAQIDADTEHLSDLEAKLLQKTVLKDTLPNSSPVNVAFNSSSFGWRLDPFNGHKAFHEGLDFMASVGTPIYASARGIVSAAEQTPDYGKIVKIDHGLGVETRYAHASLLLVHAGDRVEKGQKIAEVGSSGRSTGPHLHYEIRLDGNPLDPRKYLNASY
jgi:murein DD-endopeptidase MepM/ murein hydrolase activator NlpD